MVAAPRDSNRKIGLVGASSSDARTAVAVYVDPTTHRLKVDASISSYTGVIDGEAVDAADKGTLILGTDGSNYQIASVDSSGHLQVDVLSGGGGGTQYAVNAALGATPTGTLAIAIRDDALSALTPVEGDAIGLRVDGEGALWVKISGTVTVDGSGVTQPVSGTVTANAGTNLNTSSLLLEATYTGRVGEVQATPTANTVLARLKTIGDGQLADGHNVTIDNISTNEVYVRGSGTAGSADAAVLTIQGIASMTPIAVTESSPISGFATSAKQLADGHNVTIDNAGGVEVVQDTAADLKATVTQASAARTITSGSIDVLGDTAHDAADSGDPVKIGGKAQSHLAAPAEVSAANDRINALFDRVGRLAVYQGYVVKSAAINCSTSGNNTIVAAVATKRIRVLAVCIVSDGTTDVRWESTAGGTALTGQVPLQAREGYTISSPWGLFETTAVSALLNLELTAAVNVHGFVSYIEVDD